MMSMEEAAKGRSYAFRYTGLPDYGCGYVRAVGRDCVFRGQDYDWDGSVRQDRNICIFQYTLSGWGEIERDGQVHRLEKGQAFFVTVPDGHRYYLPAKSEHWEFYYLILPESEPAAAYIRQYGITGEYAPDSGVVRCLERIYGLADERRIRDGFESSSLAYQFVMELYRSRSVPAAEGDPVPEAVDKVIRYIEEAYGRIEGLEELSRIAGLSRFHFLRLFRSVTGTTPVEYLNKLRMEKAAALLRTTELSLDEIALKVGLANGNYFSKVFRHWVGIPPGRYRKGNHPEASANLTLR